MTRQRVARLCRAGGRGPLTMRKACRSHRRARTRARDPRGSATRGGKVSSPRLATPPVGVVDLELLDVRLGDLRLLQRLAEPTLSHVPVDLLLRVPDLDDVPPVLCWPGDVDVSLLRDPELRDDLVVLLTGCPRHVVDPADHGSPSLVVDLRVETMESTGAVA